MQALNFLVPQSRRGTSWLPASYWLALALALAPAPAIFMNSCSSPSSRVLGSTGHQFSSAHSRSDPMPLNAHHSIPFTSIQFLPLPFIPSFYHSSSHSLTHSPPQRESQPIPSRAILSSPQPQHISQINSQTTTTTTNPTTTTTLIQPWSSQVSSFSPHHLSSQEVPWSSTSSPARKLARPTRHHAMFQPLVRSAASQTSR